MKTWAHLLSEAGDLAPGSFSQGSEVPSRYGVVANPAHVKRPDPGIIPGIGICIGLGAGVFLGMLLNIGLRVEGFAFVGWGILEMLIGGVIGGIAGIPLAVRQEKLNARFETTTPAPVTEQDHLQSISPQSLSMPHRKVVDLLDHSLLAAQQATTGDPLIDEQLQRLRGPVALQVRWSTAAHLLTIQQASVLGPERSERIVQRCQASILQVFHLLDRARAEALIAQERTTTERSFELSEIVDELQALNDARAEVGYRTLREDVKPQGSGRLRE